MSDSAAAIVKDGKLLAACEEERIVRKKHYGEFPFGAIKYCLNAAEISIGDIDHVAYFINPRYQFFHRMFEIVQFLPESLSLYSEYGGKWFKMNQIKKHIKKRFDIKRKLPFEFHFVEHHLAHAASSFLLSPFDDAAILTMDESGEYTSTQFAVGHKNIIRKLGFVGHPHSVGSLYKAVTRYLGFYSVGDEAKVMGLSSYGHAYTDIFKLVKVLKKNKFKLNLPYFSLYAKDLSNKFIHEYGPPRVPETILTQKHKNIAAGLQVLTEMIALEFCEYLHSKTKSKNICIAGGVGLNCVMNGRILRESRFENIYVQPAANDAGGAIGSAFYVYNCILGKGRTFEMEHTYYGPERTEEEIEKYFRKKNVPFEKHENIEEITAKLLSQSKIIGWFQGKMEFGPRALGNRSILADPRKAEMKDRLNKRVKHREPFRPFAPSVLYEDKDLFFEEATSSPFMLIVFKVKKDKQKIIPAVTHVDGTARVQTVEKNINPKYWKLINEFKKISGIGVILNTSFNVRGEPVVCGIEDALNCFYKTEIDYLVAGKYLVSKNSV